MNIDVNGVSITLTDEQLQHIDSEVKKKNNKISAEEEFLNLWNGCTIKFDFSKSQSIFLLKNNEVLFEQDFTTQHLWCNYRKAWSIFQEKYSMNYEQIQTFIKDILERHFKLGGLTPTKTITVTSNYWKGISNWGD